MANTHRDVAERSLNEIFEIISEHFQSLPKDEAAERLQSIDEVNATARASEAQTRGRRSRKRSPRSYTATSPAIRRNARSGRP